MRTVRYLHFRMYESQRSEVNTAIMGLLAGSQLASHLLQLTTGSDKQLSEIFPNVDHIHRFNLKSSHARDILSDAENYLASMALPYVLSLHEDYMITTARLLRQNNIMTRQVFEQLKSADVHEEFEQAAGSEFSADSLVLFHLFRLLRNSQIHEGGRASAQLVTHLSLIMGSVETLWTTLTGSPTLALRRGEEIQLGQKELGAALAITKRLAEEANASLLSVLGRNSRIDLMVNDLRTVNTSLPRNKNQLLRKSKGYARMYYAALDFTEQEIADGLKRAGML